jgi:hypothetical protein
MLELDMFALGLAFLFFILGVLSDRGKVVWYGLSMALFLALGGVLATATVTKIVENTAAGTYSAVEVPVPSAHRWSVLCLGMGLLSFLFLVLTVWGLASEMLKGR